MKHLHLLKKKRTYVILVLIVLVGWWMVQRQQGNAPQYETVAVETRDLRQTVEVTGEIRPSERVDLAFKNSGTIAAMNVKVGEEVYPGTILASLKADDVRYAMKNAEAAFSAAQANLQAKIAGETTQSIQVAVTQVEQARANYDKAAADLQSTKSTTRVALQTALNDLNNQTAITEQNVSNALESARASLLTALGPLGTGLTDGDQIVGVDNTAANQSYANVLGFLDQSSLPRAKGSYVVAKQAKIEAETAVKSLNATSKQSEIESAAVKLQGAVELVQAFLGDVQKVLAASLTNSTTFTETILASKKSTIDTDRTAVSAQNTAILTAIQTIRNTDLIKTQTAIELRDAYETAKTNAEVDVRTAETNVAIQKASLDAAIATLDLKRSGPRSVDLAPLRAAVEQARVAYDKTVNDLQNVQIIASVTGTIAEIVSAVGENVGANVMQIVMVETQTYDIEAEVPEADIVKIMVGQTAEITLDAYGDDVKFMGKVTTKEPAETRVQDAIYYRIRVQIDPAEKEVKPGMTANVTIGTGESKQTMVIPLRAVRTNPETQEKTVRVLVNGSPEMRVVELGLRGDEGRVEVRKGLVSGEQVIVGETGAAMFQN